MILDRTIFLLRAGGVLTVAWVATTARAADPLPLIADVELQPVRAQVDRVVQALELAGAPLTPERQQASRRHTPRPTRSRAWRPFRMFSIRCAWRASRSIPKVASKPRTGRPQESDATRLARVSGKVANEAGVTAPCVSSPNAAKLHKPSSGNAAPPQSITPQDASERWLDVDLVSRNL